MVILLAALSGFFMFTAFAPLSLWIAAPLAIALLLVTLESSGLFWRLVSCYVFGLFFLAPLLHWTSTYVGSAPWSILVILESLFFLPLAFLTPIRSWRVFLFPSLWITIEFCRNRFPFGGFGWSRVAYSQSSAPDAMVAGIGGATILSFMTVSLGVMGYLFFRHKSKQGLVILTGVIAASALSYLPSGHTGENISILAVQGGVQTLGLNFNSRAREVFHNHLQATRSYLTSTGEKPNLIIWPENAVDVDPFTDNTVASELNALVNSYKIPILLGAVLDSHDGLHNASILWQPGKGATSIYIKRHLTPFGEYIPLRSLAQKFSPFVQDVRDFTPGTAQVIHSVDGTKIGSVICFELLDDRLVSQTAQNSSLLAVQTNSATFGLSPESAQQLSITRIRAIENQRSIVSVSTTGISAFIQKNGTISSQTSINHSQTIFGSVLTNNSRTWAQRWGASLELIAMFGPFLGVFIVFARRRLRR